jgi:TRAP transporter TAXI family solute receptor
VGLFQGKGIPVLKAAVRGVSVGLLLGLAAVSLSSCEQGDVLLSIASGPSGGAWHPIGGAIGNIINRNVPGVRASVEATEAGVQNVRLLGTGEAEIALSIAATALGGFEGKAPYSQAFRGLRTLIASLQMGYMQMVVLEDSELQMVKEIRGKRVHLGTSGHGSIPRQREIYQEMGISFDDFTPVYLPYRDALQALGDHRLDAAVLYMAPPAPSLKEFGVTHPFRLLGIQEETLEDISQKYSYFVQVVIPKDEYGLEEDVPTVATSNVVLVAADLPEELVYRIARGILENIPDLRASHPSMRDFEAEMAVLGQVLPYHPGAERYYREIGLLE